MATGYQDQDPTAQAATDWQDRQNRRKAAADLALKMGTDADQAASELDTYKKQHLADFEKAGIAGRAGIRGQAAEALANASATAGSGSGYGAMLQAGKQSGNDVAQFETGLTAQKNAFATDMMDKAQAARLAGTGQQLEAQKFIAEQGDTTSDRNTRQAELDTRIADIVKNNKGFFNDDEETMYQQIMQLANSEGDPAMKNYITQRATNIRYKKEDV